MSTSSQQNSKIKYALVAETKSNKILGEYNNVPEDKELGKIVAQVLPLVGKEEQKRTITDPRFYLHCKVQGGFTYICVAPPEFPIRACYDFIADVENDIIGTKDLKSLIKEKMDARNDNSNDKVTKVKQQIEEVKGVLMDTIDKTMKRGENLNTIVQKTEDLSNDAQIFQTNSVQLRKMMCWRRIKCTVFLILALCILGFIAAIAICGGFTFYKCKSDYVPNSNPVPTFVPTPSNSTAVRGAATFY